MKRTLLAVGLGLMAAGAAMADAHVYTVKSGDSLSKIAGQYYGDVKKYDMILEANRDTISDPTMIYPGQKLRIPGAGKSAGAGMSADQIIAEAEQELAAAKKMRAEWRLIDKATGGSAQDISKLLDVAKKAKASGDEAEAARIAARVKEAAIMGQRQANDQANATPLYGN